MFAALLPALLAVVVSWALTPVTMRLASACGAIDYPGPRKIHSCPIPRLGGVAVVLAAVTASSIMLTLPSFEGTMVRDLALALGACKANVEIPIMLLSASRHARSPSRAGSSSQLLLPDASARAASVNRTWPGGCSRLVSTQQ